MKRTLTLLILGCSVLFYSCNTPETTEADADQNNAGNDKTGIANLNRFLEKYEEPSQTFNVPINKSSVVTGRKGTKISINPNDLVTESGKPLGQNIKVELKELTNQKELLRANAQTVSDGKLLVSGGAYFIGMTSDGEKLKLKDGKTLGVRFPKLSDDEMALFYGQRDELGQMTWQKATETFKASQQPANTQSTVETTSTKSKSEIDAILDYVNSGDTTAIIREGRIPVDPSVQYDSQISQQLYDEINIAKLEWINCDRYLEIKEKASLFATFNPQDSIQSANVYLVFKTINSVMQAYYYSDKSIQFESIPVGYKARLVAYTVKGEKVFGYATELTTTKEQKITLNLKEMNDKDFKKLIGN